MHFLAHPLAERGIDELVALHPAPAFERGADDHRVEVAAVAIDLQVLAVEACAI